MPALFSRLIYILKYNRLEAEYSLLVAQWLYAFWIFSIQSTGLMTFLRQPEVASSSIYRSFSPRRICFCFFGLL